MLILPIQIAQILDRVLADEARQALLTQLARRTQLPPSATVTDALQATKQSPVAGIATLVERKLMSAIAQHTRRLNKAELDHILGQSPLQWEIPLARDGRVVVSEAAVTVRAPQAFDNHSPPTAVAAPYNGPPPADPVVEPSPPPMVAPPAVQEQRLAICRGCELYSVKSDKCSKCKCNGQGRYERLSGHCPKGLWPAVDIVAHLRDRQLTKQRH